MLDELIASDGVEEILTLRTDVGVMALHGGIEAATYGIARDIADASGASLYAVVQPHDLFWHVPSTRYDPAHSHRLRRFVAHCRVAVSVHGFGRRGLEDAVLVGGSHRAMAAAIARSLRRGGVRGIDDLEDMPAGLRGLHPANPVNLPRGGGVQLELGPGVRRPVMRSRLVGLVVAALEEWAVAGAG